LIENNLQDLSVMGKHDQSVHLEHIPHQTFQAETSDLWAVRFQPMAGPDQGIMGESFQLGQHLLGFDAFLVALRGGQVLFIFLDFDLDPIALFLFAFLARFHCATI